MIDSWKPSGVLSLATAASARLRSVGHLPRNVHPHRLCLSSPHSEQSNQWRHCIFVCVSHRDYILTHLDNFSVTRVIDGKPARLFIWDTCGSEDDDDASLPPVPKVDVVVLCFSLASRTSCLLMPCTQATPPSAHVNAIDRDCLCVMHSEERAEKMGV